MTDQTGTPLPTDNKVAGAIDTVVSDAAQIGEQSLEKAAEASQPWLAFPVIKQIFESLVNWLIGVASKAGQVLITFGVTRVQGNIENSSLLDAEKEVEAAIQSGDTNAIAKAEADFQTAQSLAVNSDGSAKPK